MSNVDQTLEQRSKTHGSFTTHAELAQRLKLTCRTHFVNGEQSYSKLDDVQAEGLEMILHKIARVLNGNPNESDHWHDIAGYAKLVDDHCQIKNTTVQTSSGTQNE